ncbi:hypothetical protein PDESU_05910 [Pontiella desulfatans]|uniref:STAS/SEC14 domain-containing protein n=1 Tax=Pontiella desulfatans TaxID=2750659 RepID=A0A6C2UD59_PONDE|nr:hypothetical protein [Pontiella desulfatans]VGO17314.1 hypothetical protein PDESU_05910 [Pontiella desulfatans]
MPFNIEYDADQDCIFATFIGKVTMGLTKEYIAALLPVLEKTGCRRVLSDSRSAELELSAMDIMQFPKMAQASPLTANLRRAVLASPGTSGYELYETLCNLQGQNVRIFPTRREALEWLLAEES